MTLKDGTLTVTPRLATLTFDLAGGTLDGKTGTFTIRARIGDEVIIPDAPTREGHTFQHWQGSKCYPGDEHKVEGDHTFIAVWKESTGVSSGNSSGTTAKGSSPKSGDGIGALAAVLSILAAASLCAIALAAGKRRGARR